MRTISRRDNGTLRVQTLNTAPSKTQQQHRDAVDINNIVAKYQQTGQLGPLREGRFADSSQVSDFHTMVTRVQDARDQFMTLPALVRREFDNDPGKLLNFLNDPNNLERAQELGLVEKNASYAKKPNEPNDQNTREKSKTKSTQTKAPAAQKPNSVVEDDE